MLHLTDQHRTSHGLLIIDGLVIMQGLLGFPFFSSSAWGQGIGNYRKRGSTFRKKVQLWILFLGSNQLSSPFFWRVTGRYDWINNR